MVDPNKPKPNSTSENAVPKTVVSRLSLYLRELQHLVRDGHETTSSKDMYEAIKDMTDDQLHMKTVVLHYDCYSIPEWNRREFPAILWRNRRANPST